MPKKKTKKTVKKVTKKTAKKVAVPRVSVDIKRRFITSISALDAIDLLNAGKTPAAQLKMITAGAAGTSTDVEIEKYFKKMMTCSKHGKAWVSDLKEFLKYLKDKAKTEAKTV